MIVRDGLALGQITPQQAAVRGLTVDWIGLDPDDDSVMLANYAAGVSWARDVHDTPPLPSYDNPPLPCSGVGFGAR